MKNLSVENKKFMLKTKNLNTLLFYKMDMSLDISLKICNRNNSTHVFTLFYAFIALFSLFKYSEGGVKTWIQ